VAQAARNLRRGLENSLFGGPLPVPPA